MAVWELGGDCERPGRHDLEICCLQAVSEEKNCGGDFGGEWEIPEDDLVSSMAWFCPQGHTRVASWRDLHPDLVHPGPD